MTMQFGMPTLIENKTLTENVELCSRLGLNFIELNMNFPEYQIDKLENADNLLTLQGIRASTTLFTWMKILI